MEEDVPVKKDIRIQFDTPVTDIGKLEPRLFSLAKEAITAIGVVCVILKLGLILFHEYGYGSLPIRVHLSHSSALRRNRTRATLLQGPRSSRCIHFLQFQSLASR